MDQISWEETHLDDDFVEKTKDLREAFWDRTKIRVMGREVMVTDFSTCLLGSHLIKAIIKGVFV